MPKQAKLNKFERGFIMLCDDLTEGQCLQRCLFGDKARKLQDLTDLEPGDIGLLLNINRDELIGIFRASSKAGLHIEPDAWDGRFAAQVKVELLGELQRITDASYILKKAGVALAQLKSGAPAPQYPVHPREVMEKILTHFKKHGNQTQQPQVRG